MSGFPGLDLRALESRQREPVIVVDVSGVC
jgi:hypothetical protein